MERPLDRKCSITSRYLELVGESLLSDDLLYENLKGEYKRAAELAETAGNSPVVLTLRAFVIVEVMAVEPWKYTLLNNTLVDGRYRLSDLPKLKLRTRSTESLTEYIAWTKELIEERAIDHVHYKNFSVAFDREGLAERSRIGAEVLTLAGEAADRLRMCLLCRSDEHYLHGGIVKRFYQAQVAVKQDPHAMLKHARNLLSITEQNAPRGWELP